jgi:pyrroline-5-carboxylate reductase
MKIAIIGGGNMGGAIARGLTQGTLVSPKNITVADLNEKVLAELTSFHSEIHVSTSNLEAIEGVSIILVAVKPWLVETVLEQIKESVDYENQIIVSIAAGVSFDELNAYLKKDDCYQPILFRVIPNTAIAILESMTIIASCNASREQELLIQSIFDELGKSIVVEERLMAAGTALASCGTAFALRYVRAAMEGGVELGFYPDAAKEIVAQTVKGAVELLMANGTHPETEIDKVTTPGGITIKGLNAMEQAGFTSAVISGLKASVK